MIKNTKRSTCFFLFFFMVMGICLSVTVLYVHSQMQLEQAQMKQVAMSRADKVTDVLTKLLYKTQVLSSLAVRSDGAADDFNQIAPVLLDDPAIRNLILAPDGVVKYVYPFAGNEAVAGLDYFSEGAGNSEAIQAKETGQLVLGGPFQLVQGGLALVGRLPVFLGENKTFWGIASVTLNYPEALAGAELDRLQEQGFAYEIWRISPDTGERQVISKSGYDYREDAAYVEYPMDILNADWYFRLSPIRLWYEFPETWIFVAAGVLLSVLFGLLMVHSYDLTRMKKEFEDLSHRDPLTGILNRRGGFNALQNIVESKIPFVIAFLDLDGFKGINDQYGHKMGDLLLKDFAHTVQSLPIDGEHLFARVGGDEFILAFMGRDDSAQIDAWFQMLREQLLATPTLWNGEEAYVSFSVGYACWPAEKTEIDDLVSLADERMYNEKSQRKHSSSTAKL